MRPTIRRARGVASLLLLLLVAGGCGERGGASKPAEAAPSQAMSGGGALVGVSGHLRTSGGPAGAPSFFWPGTIRVHGRGADEIVRTDAHGGFRVRLSPGRYALTGHSPRYGSGRYLCRADAPLIVTSGTPAQVDVICQLK